MLQAGAGHSTPRRRWGSNAAQAVHVGVMVSGELAVEEADGSTYTLRPGDALAIEPGHDAWTLGEEPAVLIQFDEGDAAARRFGLSERR